MLSEDTTDCLALSNTATLMRLIEELAERGAVARSTDRICKTARSAARGSMMPFSSSRRELRPPARGTARSTDSVGGRF